jgi:hypothetical protein
MKKELKYIFNQNTWIKIKSLFSSGINEQEREAFKIIWQHIKLNKIDFTYFLEIIELAKEEVIKDLEGLKESHEKVLTRNKELEDFLFWLYNVRLKDYSDKQYGKQEIMDMIKKGEENGIK